MKRFQDPLTFEVISASIEVHKILGGPGLREQIYEEALCQELRMRGLPTLRQVPVPIAYKGVKLRNPLLLDLLVGQSLAIEIKATKETLPCHKSQLMTYLRLSGLSKGLLINFGTHLIKEGLKRVTNRASMRKVA